MINQTLVVTAAQNIIRAKSSDCNNAILGNLLSCIHFKPDRVASKVISDHPPGLSMSCDFKLSLDFFH